MKLYSSLTSPYARKIRVLLRELGIADAVTEVLVDPFDPPEDFLARNPLSKIPVLDAGNGLVLADSKLIADWLCAQHRRRIAAEPRGRRQWQRLALRYLADGAIDAAVAIVLEKRRPEGIVHTAWIDRQSAAISRALDRIEADMALLRPASDRPGMPEITVGVLYGYLGFRLPWLDRESGRTRLAAWFAEFSAREAMRQTRPPAA